jgi:hypothetical protein
MSRFVLFASFAFLFCSFAPDCRGSDDSDRQNLNAGYFLLHHLLDDEASLPILLDLKHAPREIQDFAKEISLTAKGDMAILEKIRDANSIVSWDKNPLPKFEQDVRTSIADEKQHQLLFGTSNGDFVRALLVSQAEASNYASNIAKVLAQHLKEDPDQQRDLSRISERWHALNVKTFQLLKNY